MATTYETKYDVAIVERCCGNPDDDIIVRTCRPNEAIAVCKQFETELEQQYIGRITYHVETFESMRG